MDWKMILTSSIYSGQNRCTRRKLATNGKIWGKKFCYWVKLNTANNQPVKQLNFCSQLQMLISEDQEDIYNWPEAVTVIL